jgi:hypothetical protein
LALSTNRARKTKWKTIKNSAKHKGRVPDTNGMVKRKEKEHGEEE